MSAAVTNCAGIAPGVVGIPVPLSRRGSAERVSGVVSARALSTGSGPATAAITGTADIGTGTASASAVALWPIVAGAGSAHDGALSVAGAGAPTVVCSDDWWPPASCDGEFASTGPMVRPPTQPAAATTASTSV
ncbi:MULTISPECIES: hypothetical protein [Nocardia]|uniref:hypothetical protein n=1 Tax=Nocardia TaxID=1817 RepID=UPI0005C173F7|nr:MULTISPECIES: hypothetical protein [Nocardia]